MEPDPGASANNLTSTGMGLATAGLICGLAGLMILGPILGILAIVFGGIGLAQANKNPIGAGKSLSIAALVFGIIDVLYFLYLIATLGS